MSEGNSNPPNVIVFGQTGAGKSSLINMLAGSTKAGVSSGVSGGTSSSQSFELSAPSTIPGKSRSPGHYTFWDTPGLNEGEFGTVNAWDALDNLLNLAKAISINLVIYCVRAERFTEMIRVNYDLFWGIICEGRVPIVLVVTGLEQEIDMEAWWTNNEKAMRRMGIIPDGHACVTTTEGMNGLYDQEYAESAEKVWKLVKKHCGTKSWRMSPEWSAEVTKLMDGYMKKYNSRSGQDGGLSHLFHQAIEWLRRRVLLQRLGKLMATTSSPTNPVHHNSSEIDDQYEVASGSNDKTRNVIIFGQTGAGKSSLINMLAGETLAPVSSDLVGGSHTNKPYAITAPPKTTGNTETYTFWDTPGLNEGERGTVPAREALDNLLELTRQKGVNLVIYCIRAGRLPDILRVNYHLYWGTLRDKKVPIILVVTGLELEKEPNDWWERNAKQFKEWKMVFNAQVCVALKGDAEAYQRSKKEVWELVQKHCSPNPWKIEDSWTLMEAHE